MDVSFRHVLKSIQNWHQSFSGEVVAVIARSLPKLQDILGFVCFFGLSGPRGIRSETIKVLDTRGDYTRPKDSDVDQLNSATLMEDPKADLPEQFTICSSGFATNFGDDSGIGGFLWVQVLNEGLGEWFFIYQHPSDLSKDTDNIYHSLWFNINGAYVYFGGFGSLNFNRWHHMCIGLDLAAEEVSVVANGVSLPEKKVEGLGRPQSLTGRVVLGKNYFTGVWQQCHNLVTNLQVFKQKLSTDRMVGLTGGRECGEDGDYLAWKDMLWELEGPEAVWINTTKEAVCSQDTSVMFTNVGTNYPAALRLGKPLNVGVTFFCSVFARACKAARWLRRQICSVRRIS